MTKKNEFGLTARTELFAQLIAGGETHLDAYRKVYPKSAGASVLTLRPRSSRLAANPPVRARIASLQAAACARAGLTADGVLREIMNIAFSDLSNAFTENGVMKPVNEMDATTRAAIASWEITKDGTKIKFWDKNAALDKLMKHLGQYAIDNKQRADPLSELLAQLSGGIFEPKAD